MTKIRDEKRTLDNGPCNKTCPLYERKLQDAIAKKNNKSEWLLRAEILGSGINSLVSFTD